MGACCCAQRSKFDFDFNATGDLNGGPGEEERHLTRVLNQLPTYENMSAAYEYLIDTVISQENQTKHPNIKIDNEGIGNHPIEIMERMLQHRKERMFFMIVNLLRMRP
jgi:hypothetical protein